MNGRSVSIVALLGGFVVALSCAAASANPPVHLTYDEGEPTLSVNDDSVPFQVDFHGRQSSQISKGSGSECLRGTSNGQGGFLRVVQPLPPAAAIEDLNAAVWIRANRSQVQLHFRVVFPESVDPQTGHAVSALVAGEEYTKPGQWVELNCRATPEAVLEAVRRTRYRYPDQKISETSLYVDAIVFTVAFGPRPGKFEVFVDDLRYGPVVEPRMVATPPKEAEMPAAPAVKPPAEFRLNHLTVEGESFFPIIMPFYAEEEELDLFTATAVNVAWIPDYRDVALIDSLRSAGLWVTATPPHLRQESKAGLGDTAAMTVPFGPDTRPILFWNYSTRRSVDSLGGLIDWVNHVHAADSLFERPALADVTGGTYAFSNHIDMLAVSRHITNTSVGYRHYRDWLRHRRMNAFVSTFFWTWIQVEPDAQASLWREEAGQRPIIIEPTQIRLQLFAALQAGCRGIGYWRTIPFGSGGSGVAERRLTLTRLNMLLGILEPAIATARAPGKPFRFRVAGQRPGSTGLRVRPGYRPISVGGSRPKKTPFARANDEVGTAEAVVMRTDFGPLMLAAWFGEDAHYCPGRLARNNVNIVVPGIEETAPAWLITPTEIRLLPDERVAGGKQISLDRFDQTAVVLFTDDTAIINRLRRSVAEIAPRVAAVSVQLAQLKRARVAATHSQLVSVAPPLPDGNAILRRADQFLAEARSALGRGQYHAARIAADSCLQALRILQHAHWLDAVRPLGSPLTSPHTVSFSTLPDHYELVARLGRSLPPPTGQANILPSGGFDSHKEALDAGWEHMADSAEGISAGADLVATNPHSGRYALELYATPQTAEPPARIVSESAFVTFRSPEIAVKAGTILHISGWVNVIEPVASHRDGATIHDNILGLSSGLRWTKTDGWERFELLREIPAEGVYQLTLALHGTGRVQFDDLRIIPHKSRTSIAAGTAPARGR